MKRSIVAALIAGQILASAEAAQAADFAESRDVRTGAFAGARLRMPIGSDPERRGIQAGLTLAPTMRATASDGRSRLGIGEGVELGFRQREPVALRLAGVRLDRIGIAQGNRAPDGQRQNVSTVGWVAIGVATIVVAGAIGLAILVDQINDYDE